MGLDMYLFKARRGEDPEDGAEVGYWRKANAIHRWFVENVQDGEDDCEIHREVTREDIEKLREACKTVLEKAVLGDGKVITGYHWNGDEMVPAFAPGLVVINPEVCEETLPSQEGFFFGQTQYTEWYLSGIRSTFELCGRLLEETDFEEDALFYLSSW